LRCFGKRFVKKAAQPRQLRFLHKVTEAFFAAMPPDVRIGFAIPQAGYFFSSGLCPKAMEKRA
jgi:hypothetical protein